MGKQHLEIRRYLNEYDILYSHGRANVSLFQDTYRGSVSGYGKYIRSRFEDDSNSDNTLVSDTLQHTINMLPDIFYIDPSGTVDKYLNYFSAILYKYKVIYPKVFVNWKQLIDSYVLYQCTVLFKGWDTYRKQEKFGETEIENICDQILKQHFLFVSSHSFSIDSIAKEMETCLCNRFISGVQTNKHNSIINYCVWFDMQNGILLFLNGELSTVIKEKDMEIYSTYGVCIGHLEPEKIVKKLLLFCNLALIDFFTSYQNM